MSESIVVSLITFAAGAVGALVGAISTYIVAKQSFKRDIKKMQLEDKKKYYLAFFEAYTAFAACLASAETQFGSNVPPDEEKSLYTKLQYSCLAVDLVASNPVLTALNDLFLALNQYGQSHVQPHDINALFVTVMKEMRKDIHGSGR